VGLFYTAPEPTRGASSAKQKESVIKAELKRCISIERRWNRNEVSRGSPALLLLLSLLSLLLTVANCRSADSDG